ncbi:MAG: chemotaxis protein CheB [Pseudomonadota bacterium]
MMQSEGTGIENSPDIAAQPTYQAAGTNNFPIVGIGASAGGLDALEKFLSNVPIESGMAFVVVQHLAPESKSMLPELLQRATVMPVYQAQNAMQIRPNCVYVARPAKDITIRHGLLYLFKQVSRRGHNLPISLFFRALADDCQERSIGVILSGMGSDGTLGAHAIKKKSGIVAVQEPSTAKFNSMPRNAIAAGLADIVASAEELPARIIAFMQQSRGSRGESEALGAKSLQALAKIITLLREQTGNDFSLYKKNTIYRRVERRMRLHQLDSMDNYARYLRVNPQEGDMLFKELMIGVTNFFRDPPVWEHMKQKVLPELVAGYQEGRQLRAWVAGCSTGEEAYSLAITFIEMMEQEQPKGDYRLQIFATDLDEDAIAKARLGLYPQGIDANVSSARLARFFVAEEHGYRICKQVREMVIFAPQNIVMDPPFTRLDLLICRNLLIYLGPELQQELMPLFHFTLNPHGILLLGSAETIGNHTDLFSALDIKLRLYRRIETKAPLLGTNFPTRDPVSSTVKEGGVLIPLSTQAQMDQLMLENYTPTALLVNAMGDILYISGRTGKYLEPAAGKANWNVHVMAREGLRQVLGAAIKQALELNSAVVMLKNVEIDTSNGIQSIDVTVQLINTPESLQGKLLIVFTESFAPSLSPEATGKMTRRHRKLLLELQSARGEMKFMNEKMHTAQEQLTAANEELISTNEELQATNEELTTSKEEMESLNEELQSVNAELQIKVDDLSATNNDMKNLLDSTEIATIFLDCELNVRRFTPHATPLFRLISHDVGRQLSDIVTELDYPMLYADAGTVLRTQQVIDKLISTVDGRRFKVRIMPYRTVNKVADGVVITFADISLINMPEITEEKINLGPDV